MQEHTTLLSKHMFAVAEKGARRVLHLLELPSTTLQWASRWASFDALHLAHQLETAFKVVVHRPDGGLPRRIPPTACFSPSLRSFSYFLASQIALRLCTAASFSFSFLLISFVTCPYTTFFFDSIPFAPFWANSNPHASEATEVRILNVEKSSRGCSFVLFLQILVLEGQKICWCRQDRWAHFAQLLDSFSRLHLGHWCSNVSIFEDLLLHTTTRRRSVHVNLQYSVDGLFGSQTKQAIRRFGQASLKP